MALTHHALCSYRLSCGCIIEYSSFPSTAKKPVLCGNCGRSSTIRFRYPDTGKACEVMTRADLPENGNIRVRCCLEPEHGGDHFDDSVRLAFTTPGRLRSGRSGRT